MMLSSRRLERNGKGTTMNDLIIDNVKRIINDRELIQTDLDSVKARIVKSRVNLASRLTDGTADTFYIEKENLFLKRLVIRERLLTELLDAVTPASADFITEKKILAIQLLRICHWAKNLNEALSRECTDLEREEYRFIKSFVTDFIATDFYLLMVCDHLAKTIS